MSTTGQDRRIGSTWSLLSQPRIRHITEIRIHNLDVHAQDHPSSSHPQNQSRHHQQLDTHLDDHHEASHGPSSPSLSFHHIRNVRKSSQNSIHPPALQEVREIADEEGYLVEDDQVDGDPSSRSPGRHARSRTSTGTTIRDPSSAGGANIGWDGGRSLSSSSLMGTSTARLTRSPRLMPRRASSNETIGDYSTSTVVVQGRRPGLNQARSRSRLIVPRPNTVVETDSPVDDAQQHAGGLNIDIPGATDHHGMIRTRDRSNSGSSFRSGHYSSHPNHHQHISHHHHLPHHHSSYSSQNHLQSQSHPTSSTTETSGLTVGSPTAPINTIGGRRERASTITSQYAINSAGHVALTDELGYEKKKDLIGEQGEGVGGLGGVDGAVERELVRCFVTMILVEDLRAVLMQQEEEGTKEEVNREKGRPPVESSRTGKNKVANGNQPGVAGSPPKAVKIKPGSASIKEKPIKQERRASGSIAKASPDRSPKLLNQSRLASGLPTTPVMPSPQGQVNSQTPRQPGARTRPPASRQNTMRNASSGSCPNKSSASPNRVARLVSPSRSRYGSPPQSPGLGTAPSRVWSRRSSDVGSSADDVGSTGKTLRNSSSKSQQQASDAATGIDHGKTVDQSLVPFYVSPIHRKSLYPTFSGINVLSDYASWARDLEEGVAGVKVLLEAWIEDGQASRLVSDDHGHFDGSVGWKRLNGVGGVIDLAKLREVEEDRMDDLPNNTLIFRFSSTSSKTYYLPSEQDLDNQVLAAPVRRDVRSVVERSLRETKMQKSVDLEGLERLVAVSRILREGQSEVKAVEERLERTLKDEGRSDRMLKTNSQVGTFNHNLEARITSLCAANSEARKTCTERRKALANRRERLERADTMIVELRDRVNELEEAVSTERQHRDALSHPIYRHRARLINTLDTIFPISPLDPSSLLYTILSIPLPIPTDPKSPAPPDSVPPRLKIKVDEESTATALGMVAMCLQRLGEIVGGGDELVYPVTCVGSRSLVRDGISVISGPRSFPLYSKGVERYRYEYAIFLLNKDIEMMMIQADILVQDPRHTLPNLKTLLLTLASRDRPRGVQVQGRETAGNKVERESSVRGSGKGTRSATPLDAPSEAAGSRSLEMNSGRSNTGHRAGSTGPGSGKSTSISSTKAGSTNDPTKSLSMLSLAALSGGRMG